VPQATPATSLRAAKIHSHFSLDRVIVEGALTMNPLQVEHDLVEDRPATFIALELTVAETAGQLSSTVPASPTC
jgi:hypothetical protein